MYGAVVYIDSVCNCESSLKIESKLDNCVILENNDFEIDFKDIIINNKTLIVKLPESMYLVKDRTEI